MTYAEELFHLGNALAEEGNYDGAVAAYLQAMELAPRQRGLLNNLGMAYVKNVQPNKAEEIFRRLLTLDPDYAEGWNNLAVAVQTAGDPERATELFRKAVALDPNYAEAWYNLGFALEEQRNWGEAITCNRRAIRIRPDYADAHFNLALLLLLTGQFQEGWREYEWRWLATGFSTPLKTFAQPCWDGRPFPGKTLLVHCEQGFGDVIQFIRYVTLAAERGGSVVVAAPSPLADLLSVVPGVAQVVVDGPWPPFNLHIPLMSLPLVFQTEAACIPGNVPYLQVRPEKLEEWAQRLAPDGSFKAGLVWSGRLNTEKNRRRACPPACLEPLFAIGGISWYSLQMEEKEQRDQVLFGPQLKDLTDRIETFADTAAIIANLDLVVSIDTAVCHLAGALGKEVWTLLCRSADWRWLLDRNDSPWYPTMRLYRQERAGDWAGVVAQVAAALADKTAALSPLDGAAGVSKDNGKTATAPESAFAGHMERGIGLFRQGNMEGAAAEFAAAAALDPAGNAALINRGAALEALGRTAEAITCYRRVLAVNGSDHDALYNLAHALAASGDDAGAVAVYRELLVLAPGHGLGWYNLGNACRRLGYLEDAEAAYGTGVALMPDHHGCRSNLGLILQALGRLDEAASRFEEIIEKSGDPEGYLHLAMLRLLQGDYEHGWPLYEWRWQAGAVKPEGRGPEWRGENLAGRTILVYCEQGFGDSIQFSRYIPLLVQRGGRVLLECQAPCLKSLMETVAGVAGVFCRGESLPPYDLCVPMMSLPGLFGTSTVSIPAPVPYLNPPGELVRTWGEKMGRWEGLSVGLVWAGNSEYRNDRQRSLDPALLAPLLEVAGARFFSLQVGERSNAPPAGLGLIDLTPQIGNFLHTAALIANLDLVISVDTAVAHLAGALGKPVWILLPFAPDWRWQLYRHDSPWYPTMRLFRQERPGNWAGVIDKVREALLDLAAPRLKLYFYRPGEDYLLPPRLQAIKIPLLYDEAAPGSATAEPRYDVLSIWQEDEVGRPVSSCRDGYHIAESPAEADFIVFPERIDELLENFGGEGASRFLRQLPLFAEYEEKHVFLTVHDKSEPLGTDAVIFRTSASTGRADPHTYVFPYRTEDFSPYLHFDLSRIDYHTSFIGFTGSSEIRRPLMESIVAEKRLISHLDANERFYGHLPKDALPDRRARFLEYMARSMTVLCPKGTGENTFRFFEAMSMGRIPVLISDGCMLPFASEIDYDAFMMCIPEGEVHRGGRLLYEWIAGQSEAELMGRCRRARAVWEEYCRFSGISRQLLAMLAGHRKRHGKDERKKI